MSDLMHLDLLQHLWQSSLFAFAACVVLLTFRKGSTWSRHFIAWAAYLKFLVPFSLFADPLRILLDWGNHKGAPEMEALPPLQALSFGLDLEFWIASDVAVGGTEQSFSLDSWGAWFLLGGWAVGSVFFATRRWLQYRKLNDAVMECSRPADPNGLNLLSP